jgi:hypothetical protein
MRPSSTSVARCFQWSKYTHHCNTHDSSTCGTMNPATAPQWGYLSTEEEHVRVRAAATKCQEHTRAECHEATEILVSCEQQQRKRHAGNQNAVATKQKVARNGAVTKTMKLLSHQPAAHNSMVQKSNAQTKRSPPYIHRRSTLHRNLTSHPLQRQAGGRHAGR